MKNTTTGNNYIDKVVFYNELKKHKEVCKQCKKNNQDEPMLPNYIGECFILIANKFSNYPKFINYSYKDEMILDGIEHCMKYWRSFDVDKYDNPFAYFTKIMYHAFVMRIKKENKLLYLKYKIVQQSGIEDILEQITEEDVTFDSDIYDNINEFIDKYEKSMEVKKDIIKTKLQEKKDKLAKQGIDRYIDE